MDRIHQSPELIFAVIAAVLVKVKASKTLTLFGALLTILIATLAGLFLHVPIRNLLNVDPSQDILVAVVTALLFESIAKWMLDITSEPDGVKRLLTAIVLRDPTALSRDDDKKDG